MFVGKNLCAFIFCELPHDIVSLAKHQVDEETEQLLEEDGEDQAKCQLIFQGHHRKPQQR